MSTIVRFAPSPTGKMHIGNARIAIMCFLMTKKNNGKFILRIDDTDKLNIKEEYVTSIRDDLEWLNLSYDSQFRQSDRLARYAEVIEDLQNQGIIYKCYETVAELMMQKKILLKNNQPPIYNRRSLHLTNKEISEYEQEGRGYHWRFLINRDKNIQWHDEILGEINFKGSNLSDPVVIRENGMPTYLLPSAIDDVDYNISHIIRGADHVSNTAIQIQMFELLKAKSIKFAHIPLLKTAQEKISKSKGSEYSIDKLREKMLEPETIFSYIYNLGNHNQRILSANIADYTQSFNIKNYKSGNLIIVQHDAITSLNKDILSKMNFLTIHDRCLRKISKNITEKFWYIINNNIHYISDIEEWYDIFIENKVSYLDIVFEKDHLETALAYAGNLNAKDNTWFKTLTNHIKEKDRAIKPKLYSAIRLALTGRNDGPILSDIICFLGHIECVNRFRRALQYEP